MRALLRKIKQILRNRRTRRIFTRFIGGLAALVVFVTTYALVLPAITMESMASCGIEAHQHDDACYSEELVCGIPESEGHAHTESCYRVTKVLVCGSEEHVHGDDCYDGDGTLVCEKAEHVHDDAKCYEEVTELACGLKESEGHHHDASCYEKVLTCGREAHTHSAACYEEENSAVAASTGASASAAGAAATASAASTTSTTAADAAAAAASKAAGAGSEAEARHADGADTADTAGKADKSAPADGASVSAGDGASAAAAGAASAAGGVTDASNAATTNVLPEDLQTESLSEGYVPALDPVDMAAVLDRHTGIYYFHAEPDEDIPASSADITDWKEYREGSTELAPSDLLRLYLSYSLPAGTLNETNQVARYRLPANIHLTDDQILAINGTVNGIASQYVSYDTLEITDPERYDMYLGAEAIEGTRTPDQKVNDYLYGLVRSGRKGEEYISAIVKAENVFDDRTGDCLGTDLIFIFTPYTIEKNQNTYDANGTPASAGEKVSGWFTFDLNMEQVDWETNEENLGDSTNDAAAEENVGDVTNDISEEENAATITIEKTAKVTFAAEDRSVGTRELSTTLKLVETAEQKNTGSGEASADTEAAADNENAESADNENVGAAAVSDTAETAIPEEETAYQSGTLTASGDTYKITLDYTAEACIPENAELQVREITAETDPEAYEACLEQAKQQVSSDTSDDNGKTTVDTAATRFFDIEIVAPVAGDNGESGKKEKIEPAAPVAVNIQLADASANTTSAGSASDDNAEAADQQKSDPTVLHFAEDGVETLESTTTPTTVDNSEKSSTAAGNDIQDSTGTEQTSIQFETSSFSIYGVVYTVDFSFVVDGKLFEFSMEGGKAVSYAKLAEVLHIAEKYSPGEHGVDETNAGVTVEDTTSNGAEELADAEEPADGVEADTALDGSDGSENEVLGSTDTEEVSREDIEISDATKEFISQVEKIEFSNPDLLLVEKIEEKTTTGDILSKYDVVPEYPYGITDQEYCDNYMREYDPVDWVLISLKAFDTPEALTVTMKSGDSFIIEVTDAADAVMVNDDQYGSIAQTITNPSGTTIDLFDYWITDALRGEKSMSGWPGYNGSGYSFQDYDYDGNRLSTNDPPMAQDRNAKESTWYVQNGHLRGNGNNQGINEGHVFKFYPGAAGTVVDRGYKDTHTDWTNNHDEYSSINSWTGDADPTTGLIEKKLNSDGYPQLTQDTAKGTDGTPLSYLFDNSLHDGKQKYRGVDNLLYVDSDGYYTYDSRYYSATYQKEGANQGNFILREHNSNATNAQKGFWPFGERVNWHGMHMTTQFSMPTNGQVLNPKGEYKDMQFEFSGDDDTWLFIDGILVGDGGGIHNRTEIDINFKTGVVTVTGKKDDNHQGTYETTTTLRAIFEEAERNGWVESGYVSKNFDSGSNTFKQGSYHKFEMFYLERGGSESNLYIHYNLVSMTDFSAHKSYHSADNSRLLRDQFQFELIGFDNTAYSSQGDEFIKAIMPDNGTSTGNGTVASPKKVHKDTAPVGIALPEDLSAHTSLITGVTEDGNVNFGNVQIQASQAGKEYKYAVREVVPDDAINADGIRWDQASNEVKEEGGFVKNGITYDGKVYYFKGTVQLKEGSTSDYELVKTRYTDETYGTVDNDTKFFSFINGYIKPLSLKVVKKSNSDRLLSGATFTLTHAKKEISGEGSNRIEKWVPRSGSIVKTGVTDQGNLTFTGLAEGHYILEEAAAPAGYQKGTTSKWLITITKEDSTDEIVLNPSIVALNDDGTVNGTPQTMMKDNYVVTHNVTNTKISNHSIKIRKAWLEPDGVTELSSTEIDALGGSNVTIEGQLWRRWVDINNNPQEGKVGDFTLSSSSNPAWEQTWSSTDLAEGDFDYEYFLKKVSEPNLEGFTFISNPSVTNETDVSIYTVKNIKEGEKTGLTVKKVWGDNSTKHTNDTVRFKILRTELNASGETISGPYEYIEDGESAPKEYELKASTVPAWTYSRNDLPKNNGKESTDSNFREYKYTVEETSTFAKYAVSYKEAGNERVILNTPTDNQVTVEKKWVDSNGNAITSGIPDGAYITGKLKRTYTYQIPDGATVNIYYAKESNGSLTYDDTPSHIIENVQLNSELAIWIFTANSQAASPANVTEGKGNNSTNIAMNNTAPYYRSFEMKDSGGGTFYKNTGAYTTTITKDTDIYVYWGYNLQNNPPIYFEENHELGAGGGVSDSQDDNAFNEQFRLDDSNNWKFSWTALDLNEDPTRTYTYYMVDVEEYTADGTKVTNYEGFSAPDISSMVKGSDQKWYASITNEQDTPQKGSLNITKAVTAGANATDKTFTFDVILKNSDDTVFTGNVNVTDKTRTTATSVTPDSNGKITVTVDGAGTASITDIPARTKYTVTEPTTAIPAGWKLVSGDGANGIITAGQIASTTFTNTPTQFAFSKVWKNKNGSTYDTWQTDIVVTLYRKSSGTTEQVVKVFNISNGTATIPVDANSSYPALLSVTSTAPTAGSEKLGYKYTVTGEGLTAYDNSGNLYEYYVKESDLTFYDTTYGIFTGDQHDTPIAVNSNTSASDGGVIINTPKDAYELPSTGGPGTRLFTILGGILILGAGALLWRRRRLI